MGCSSSCCTTEALASEVVVAPQVETAWSRLGGEELEGPISSGLVALVRADWLVQLAESGGTLRRRQDLPADAFVGLEELKAGGAGGITFPGINWDWLRVIVLSYPWLQPGHPDPHGQNLRVIAKALKAFVQDSTYSVGGFDFQYFNGGKPYGVLIDFTAMFQAPRTREETEQFKKALPELNRFYSHPNTVVLKVTRFPEGYPTDPGHPYELPEGSNTVNYSERGWCYAESAMSGLVKDSCKVLDLGRLPHNDALANVISECMSGREPPLSPDELDVELNRKVFTSKKDDFEKVAQLYRSAFAKRVESATELKYAALGWGASQVQQLMQALRSNHVLQSLDLAGNRMGHQGADIVGQALQRNNTLQTLKLMNSGIGVEGANALGQALQLNSTLRTLDLMNNSIGVEGANALGQALQHNSTLQTLDVANNGIGVEGANAFGQALQRNNTLQTLGLMNNGIRGEGANALGQAVQHNNTLQTLDLANNGIGVQGASAFGQALRFNNTLQTLSLAVNNIGAEGTNFLGQALQLNRALQTLNLVHNNIGTEGARVLGQALQPNNTLQTLVLCNNDIGEGGANAVGEALEHNTSLTALSLYHCRIGATGTRGLAQALRGNSALTQLDVGRNIIGPEGVAMLAEALPANRHLTALNLGDSIDAGGEEMRGTAQVWLNSPDIREELDREANRIGDDGARALGQAVLRNGTLAKLNIPARGVSEEELRLLQQAALARSVDLVID